MCVPRRRTREQARLDPIAFQEAAEHHHVGDGVAPTSLVEHAPWAPRRDQAAAMAAARSLSPCGTFIGHHHPAKFRTRPWRAAASRIRDGSVDVGAGLVAGHDEVPLTTAPSSTSSGSSRVGRISSAGWP